MGSAISSIEIKKFFGHIKAVDGVTFEVKEGEVIGLLGPNGAGKTTLINILTTLVKPTSGTAKILGYDINNYGIKIRELIGVVFQESNFDRYLTARENLIIHAKMHGMSKADYNKKIDELLDLTGLRSREKDFPEKFSHGMKKRLIFARALIHNPKILFLDEPTTGLDPQARFAVWDYIQMLKRNTTIFLTTHYMEEADYLCNRIIIIDNGKVLAEGTKQELIKITGNVSATLNDIFLHLTGRGLRD